MSQAILKLYHLMPAPMKSLAATVRGLQLRSLRYGRETDELVALVLERDYWSRSQWESWKLERLDFILRRAAERVPYYREQWASRISRGDRSCRDRLESWPVLEK